MTPLRMRLPDLGEGVVEAELVSWLVSVGDVVTPDTPIAEVMTDKSTVELTAPVSGTIATILTDEGAIVAVGTEIIVIDRDEGVTNGDIATATTKTSPTDTAPIPEAEDDIWPASSPDRPETKPRPEPFLGHDRAASTTETRQRGSAPTDPHDARPAGRARPRAAPTVRRRAAERGIDLATVDGSGPGGRILMEDLERATLRPPDHARAWATSRRPDAREPLRGLRRTIASRMTTAWAEVPHITYVDEVDVEQVENYRATVNDSAATSTLRCTLLSFVARAVIVACHDQPRLNATFDTSESVLQVHGAVHLGIATQTPAGLVVPVIRDADLMSLTELTHAIKSSADAARHGTLGREELTGSTITISSLGRLGGLVTTPIVNHPEVAVVGVNSIQTRAVWRDGSFTPRRVMNLSSSFDHRIIDGWDAAVFIQRIKSLLENPAMLTIGWAL